MSITWLARLITPMPGAEAEERGGDRKAHRAERAEADQQDQDRRGDPDDRREPERRLLSLLDRLAAELDVERRRARRLGGRDHPVDRRHRERVRALVEVDGREADRPVAGDRVLARRVRADDARDVRQRRRPAASIAPIVGRSAGVVSLPVARGTRSGRRRRPARGSGSAADRRPAASPCRAA